MPVPWPYSSLLEDIREPMQFAWPVPPSYLKWLNANCRFTPPKSETELRESLREVGVVTCTCTGFDGDDQQRHLILDPNCPVHTDRCFACGQKRRL